MGTPFFSDVTLTAEGDSTLNIKLVNALVVITQNKKIGRTYVAGRSGSVKEYHSLEDYNIEITGTILQENPTKYPEDEVKKILAIYALPCAVKISCPFTDLFQISAAVIRHYKLDQKAGVQNQQFFLIKMYIDLPVEPGKVN